MNKEAKNNATIRQLARAYVKEVYGYQPDAVPHPREHYVAEVEAAQAELNEWLAKPLLEKRKRWEKFRRLWKEDTLKAEQEIARLTDLEQEISKVSHTHLRGYLRYKVSDMVRKERESMEAFIPLFGIWVDETTKRAEATVARQKERLATFDKRWAEGKKVADSIAKWWGKV